MKEIKGIYTSAKIMTDDVEEYYTREGEKELKQKGQEVPYPLTWITGSLLEDYLHDCISTLDMILLAHI